ncbi:c-type cytochrome [Deinococcus sp. Marseille-Q6407]|uniref:c-type cytochrome n=1 Tax=Deinococcus sp. Marseille-Q6407 TaxID=2969223 RepID=UPI0021C0B0DF|nr:cytochrome c [Deinococcus sp. Marseille-Q6407]
MDQAKSSVWKIVAALAALFVIVTALLLGFARTTPDREMARATQAANGRSAQTTSETSTTTNKSAATASSQSADNNAAGTQKGTSGQDSGVQAGTTPAGSKDGAGNQAPDAASVTADNNGEQVVQHIFDATEGADVFAQACQACHMPGGVGVKATDGAGQKNYPALANNPNLQSPQYPLTFILNGVGGMPSFAADLTNEQIASVVNYLRHDLNKYDGDTKPEDVEQMRSKGPVKALGGGAG